MKKHLIPFLTGLALLAACSPDKEATPAPSPDVFILSEGQFGVGDGAVSGFNRGAKVLTGVDLFGGANNGAKLGDVVQHMGVQGNKGYVVVNASKKVEVVTLPDFKTAGTISGVEQPRYFTSTSATRGYLTEWRGNYSATLPNNGYLPGVLSILDLATNTVTSRVTVGIKPEQLLALGGKIYVPNYAENTISVIDEATGTLSATIATADAPSSLVADKNGDIWVLCAGFVNYPSRVSAGSLVRFSPGSPTTQFRLTFPNTSGPGNLRLNPAKDQLYYSFGGAEYQLPITATALPATPFIRRNFSGFGIDPRDNTVYGAISPSYSSNGRFIRYQATGAPIDSFEVKVGPNGFVFY